MIGTDGQDILEERCIHVSVSEVSLCLIEMEGFSSNLKGETPQLKRDLLKGIDFIDL